jgi:shikimate kinase
LIGHRLAATSFQFTSSTAYCTVNSARSIVLVGMMGAGKSSVGRCLQRRTGLARMDTDEMVAEQFGLSIPQIFETHGEQKFRDAETEALSNLAHDRSMVMVTGGGIVLRPQNIGLLKQLGTIVWLNADEATLFERASRRNDRPLLQNENPRTAFSKLLRERLPLYRSAADFEVDTSRMTHDEVAEAILSKLEELSAARQ